MTDTRITLGGRTFARSEVVDALKASKKPARERKGPTLPFDRLEEDTRPSGQRCADKRYQEPGLFD